MRHILLILLTLSIALPLYAQEDEESEEIEVIPVECLNGMDEATCERYVNAVEATAATGSFAVDFTITLDYTDNPVLQSAVIVGDGAIAVTPNAFDGAKIDTSEAVITLADGTTISGSASFILDAEVLAFGLGADPASIAWQTASDYQYGALDLTLAQASAEINALLDGVETWELTEATVDESASLVVLSVLTDAVNANLVINTETNMITTIQVQREEEDTLQTIIFELSDFGRFRGEIDLPDDFEPLSLDITRTFTDYDGGLINALLRTFLTLTVPEPEAPQAAVTSDRPYVSECFNRRTAQNAGSVGVGETVEGFIESRTYDSWAFEGSAGQTISIVADTVLDGYLEVLLPDGSGLASDDLPENTLDQQIMDLTLPQDGTYSILFCIRPSMLDEGYTLTVSGSE